MESYFLFLANFSHDRAREVALLLRFVIAFVISFVMENFSHDRAREVALLLRCQFSMAPNTTFALTHIV